MKLNKMILLGAVCLLATSVNAESGGKMKGSVQNAITLKKEGKTVEPIFTGPFKVMGIGLMKGQKLEKHQTPTAAFLYVQSGGVLFSMNGKKESLQAGDFFSIPAKELHEVEASEDSRLMLIK